MRNVEFRGLESVSMPDPGEMSKLSWKWAGSLGRIHSSKFVSSVLEILHPFRVKLCKTSCRCLFSSKISINMRVYSHYCWLRFHMTLVKMDRKEPLKWCQHRSLVKCIAIWPLYERGGKNGKFSMTETVCELEMPSELPRQNSAELCISKPETGERAVQIRLSFVGK